MSVFAQTGDGDLLLENGQLVIVRDVAEVAAIELRNKFLFVRGEHFLDTRQGVPYFEYVFVKNPNVAAIRSLFREVILSVKGVSSILELTITIGKDRKGHFSFRALASNGRVIAGGSDTPFIVEPV